MDEEEDKLLGEESGNKIPKNLIDNESFDEIYDKLIDDTSKSKNN